MAAEVPVLRGPHVLLRPLSTGDLKAVERLPLDIEAMRMFGVEVDAPRIRTAAEAQREFDKLQRNPLLWVIDAGGYIGHIHLHDLHAIDRRAKIAIWIEDPAQRGHGFGTEAIRLVLTHAFGTMGLHRIGIRVLDINTVAQRAYEKCGFVREGRERETACLGGVWHDDLMLGCLAHEFKGQLAPPNNL